ncbi:type 4a pilus biogenesis protein PilO [Oceanobacter mangrovi]|uniref:type 4a pilus biogenesis protein PilO n=1 Tax=Oceanobacter mangrovi TaxID=2862510 RepID=UPI001C8EEC6D|nr:type 4a pilus biogenesis protein PilO [Oceanobacter mangrovi]
MAKQGLDFNAWLEKAKQFDVNDLNEIDWNNMGGWPLGGKVFFCLLVFVAVIVGGYFLLVKDTSLSLDNAVAQESKLKQDIERKAFKVANLDAYREQLAEMQDSFGSLLKQLPKDTEVPGLIDDISATALGAGLKLNAISPQPVKKTEFYNELPITVEVAGGYHEMGAFVSGVAALPRIVTLHDFSITKGKSSTDESLSMKILAKTYQYGGGDE